MCVVARQCVRPAADRPSPVSCKEEEAEAERRAPSRYGSFGQRLKKRAVIGGPAGESAERHARGAAEDDAGDALRQGELLFTNEGAGLLLLLLSWWNMSCEL